MNFDKLNSLVGKNYFDEVFSTLEQGIPSDDNELREQLSLIESNYSSFKKKERLHILSHSETITEKSKITLSLLEFINEVKKKLT